VPTHLVGLRRSRGPHTLHQGDWKKGAEDLRTLRKANGILISSSANLKSEELGRGKERGGVLEGVGGKIKE